MCALAGRTAIKVADEGDWRFGRTQRRAVQEPHRLATSQTRAAASPLPDETVKFTAAASPPARLDEEPGDHRRQHDQHQHGDLQVLDAPEPVLDRLAGEVADACDDRRPDERADEVEEGEAPRRDAAAADHDRAGDAQAVAEAQQHHRRRVPAPDEVLDARRLGGERREAREDALAVAPPDEEAGLVAEESAGHRDAHDFWQLEIAVGGREAGQREDRLTLEECTDEYRDVAELDEQVFHGYRLGFAYLPPIATVPKAEPAMSKLNEKCWLIACVSRK